jgi:hypothetical protein
MCGVDRHEGGSGVGRACELETRNTLFMTPADPSPHSPGESAGWERAVPDLDGEPAIADTLYAATEELEHAAPELRARADSIADVIAPLVHRVDASSLQIDEPDPAALLPDDEATHLAGLLTAAAAQANDLAAVLTEAADQAEGLAAVLTDDHPAPE